MIRRPPRSTLPYTTLFRSDLDRDPLASCTGAHEIDRTDFSGPLAPDEAELLAERLRLRGELVLQDERSEEHTSELQSRLHLVCRLLLEKKKKTQEITKERG